MANTKGATHDCLFFSFFLSLALIVFSSVKSSATPSAKVPDQFKGKTSSSLDFYERELEREEEQIFRSTRRGLLKNSHYKTTEHDSIDPPTTTFPTTPITNPVTTPAGGNLPPEKQAPIVVTIPATNPVSVNPSPTTTTTTTTNPTPVTIPSSTPVNVPGTNPVNTPIPVTNPVTNPSTVPVTNPVTTPATSTNPVNSPAAVPGQSWCIAKNGASQAAVQAALDYACGIGGADCATIQQGASCYNPNTLQNHASYAFNSYYQKNPTQTSCDFGGSAVITNTNPSTGSCIFPTSSSSSSPVTANPTPTPTVNPTPTPTVNPTPTPTVNPTPTPTVNPTPTPTVNPTPTPMVNPSPTTTTPTPTTSSSSGSTMPGSVSPPAVFNSGMPDSGTTTVFGPSPPTVNSSAPSMSTSLRPFVGCFVFLTSITTGRLILNL